MESLKIMKFKCPVSKCNLLVPSLWDSNLSSKNPKSIGADIVLCTFLRFKGIF